MSIMGDLTDLSGETDGFCACASLADKCTSLCDPIVDVLDLVPSDSLSETSWTPGEMGEASCATKAGTEKFGWRGWKKIVK